MPYCSQCGSPVSDDDRFCGKCGARQPPTSPRPVQDPLSGMSPRTASILCYIPAVGWIASIVVLASERFRHNRTLRFHAFQGLYLFVAWLIEDWVLHPVFRNLPGLPGWQIDNILKALLLFMSIFMIIKASHEEAYSLPIIGELAQRSASEN